MLNSLPSTSYRFWLTSFVQAIVFTMALSATEPLCADEIPNPVKQSLEWTKLPNLPDSIGVAGPYVGVSKGALIVAGGANFPVSEGQDLWEVPKVWHDEIWVLPNSKDNAQWQGPFHLDRPRAYGGVVTTPDGIVCIGGNDDKEVFADVFLLRWNSTAKKIEQVKLPDLPNPIAFTAATLIGETVYVAGGQLEAGLDSASSNFWRMDMSTYDGTAQSVHWKALPTWPGPARAFNLVVAQHNGFDDCVYVISGRHQGKEPGGSIKPLRDVYEFNPGHYDPSAYDSSTGTYTGDGEVAEPWRRRADSPVPVMAGTAASVGQSHIFVLSGADGTLFHKADELRDDHPGFPTKSWSYHTITDTWIQAGQIPNNQVTTTAVKWNDAIIVASGEVRPRVRTPAVWQVKPIQSSHSFGVVNFTVLVIYLLAMIGVGVYFMNKNKNTDDYFRGGQNIPWWAAAASIFATMLSSVTFMAIPAKAYAQDWVYLVGCFAPLLVAPIAVYIALPFFRRLDVTSAYEYLELRFNRSVRMFASTLFILFHVFRMAIVMSLAGLALASVTPMSPLQCVLIMGALSVTYSTLGGIEAVVWTDTIQTVILLAGAVLCFALAIMGIEGGFAGAFDHAASYDKFHFANLHLDMSSASLALVVVIFGSLGQNFSSYTSDQAVVQRYMTTPDIKRAAASIWLAAAMAIPASFLFFGLGTVLFAYYRDNPDKLDPTYMTDQILPLFIVQEVPVGIAGLIVASIFAAAQSTVSTSMNSTATVATVDFYRPLNLMKSEKGYLNAARVTTLLFGIVGTMLAILFIQPDTKSLFDEFIKVIGLFMGVLGGVFALGVLTVRCNGWGAMTGMIGSALVVFSLPIYTQINGYIYGIIGILTCFAIGYLTSLAIPNKIPDLDGLTIHTVDNKTNP